VTLKSTQPLTEMSTRNILADEGCPASEAGNFTAICEQTVSKMCDPRRLTYGPPRPVTEFYSFTFTYFSLFFIIYRLFPPFLPFMSRYSSPLSSPLFFSYERYSSTLVFQTNVLTRKTVRFGSEGDTALWSDCSH
jgi:hypothetical protein